MPITQERRYLPAEFRLAEPEAEPAKIVGYAALFDSPTVLMAGTEHEFVEVIRPGAFKKDLEQGADIRALVDHDPSRILGRTTAGTLRLREDDRGLAVEIDPPDTSIGRDTITSLRRGDLDQMSFAFLPRAGGEHWNTDDEGRRVRELIDLETFDVSIVTYPAYPETSVAVRSLAAWQAKQAGRPRNARGRLGLLARRGKNSA